MIDRGKFQEGMNRIATAVRQVADAATQGVFLDAFSPRMDTDEWTRFSAWAAATTPWVTEPRYRTFPSVPELVDALRKFRGERPLLSEATEAYERVLAAGEYNPESGTTWTYRHVRETCGEAAAQAFLAAGGSSAFVQTWDEPKRRERFAAGYAEAVRDDPRSKLLPSPDPAKLLPAGDAEPPRPPTREEAATVVKRLQDMVGVQPAPRKVVEVEATDERKAQLLAALGVTPEEARAAREKAEAEGLENVGAETPQEA